MRIVVHCKSPFVLGILRFGPLLLFRSRAQWTSLSFILPLHLSTSPPSFFSYTKNALPNPHEPSKQMKLLKEGGSEVTHEMILKLIDEVGGTKHYQRLLPCRLSRGPFVIPSLDRLRRRNC